MLLEGIFLPLTTPFDPDGRLFLRKLEANVARYSLTPAAGMVVGASETDALSDDETRALLAAAMHTAADEKGMLAAVGRASLARTLTLAECAATAGYDAVTVRAVQTGSWAEELNYLRMVADRCALPVVLDRVPTELVQEIAGHTNVLGAIGTGATALQAPQVSREVMVTSVFLAATGRMVRRGSGLVQVGSAGTGAPPVKTRSKKVGFQVLESSSMGMLAAWKAGAAGAVPRLGPCAPQACCEVWQAYKDGDQPLAEEKQARILEAGRMAEDVAHAKYGCDVNGYYGGSPRLPRFALSGAERAEVERVLAGLKT